MIVEKYIRNLLYEHDCVVIPELGGFIAHYVSAAVHPIRHTFLPPSKEIAFNELLKLNDGLLTSHVAKGEHVSHEEATRMVSEFAAYVEQEIRRNQKYLFEEIGILSLNIEQRLQFEAFNRVNYLSESFGLPELINRPVERAPALQRMRLKDRPAVVSPVVAPVSPVDNAPDDESPVVFREVKRQKRNAPWLAVIVAAVVVSFGSGYFLLGNGNSQLSSLNPFTGIDEEITADDSLLNADPYHTLVDSTRYQPAFSGADETSFTDEATVSSPQPETFTPSPVAPEAAQQETRLVSNDGREGEEVKGAVKKVSPEAKERKTGTNVLSTPTAAVDAVLTTAGAVQRYYVIVGGFGVEKNAFKLKKALSRKGYTTARVIRPDNQGLHKVSATDFDNQPEADAKAQEMKAEYGNAVWVLKF